MEPTAGVGEDEALRAGCAAGETWAFDALATRYGRLLSLVGARVLDEIRGGPFDLRELASVRARAERRLEDREIYARWRGRSLAPLVAALARQEAESYAANETPIAAAPPFFPVPTVVSEDPGALRQSLARLEPIGALLVRLRLRGLDLAAVARPAARPADAVVADLRRIAERFAALDVPVAGAEAIWRVLLSVASIEERVAVALRTVGDATFREDRRRLRGRWRALASAELGQRRPVTPGPLATAEGVATFVDGAPGASRTSGHLATCVRCADDVARLVLDMRAAEALGATRELPEPLALAAVSVATGRPRAAMALATDSEPGSLGEALLRLAMVGEALTGPEAPAPTARERSGVLEAPPIPSDEEAPLYALEALVAGDARTAARAIDDHAAKGTVGRRLRLLAAASGDDVALAQRLATEILAAPSPDPGLALDARAVKALPPDEALPPEMLAVRLRHALPDAVRFTIARS
ncbi:MAG: hypothetical protein AAGH15_02080 [Myxococcota bacterium]